LNKNLKSALKTSLMGIGLVFCGNLFLNQVDAESFKDKKIELGITHAIASNSLISFPNDYIAFILLAGVLWPWLKKNKWDLKNKYYYLMGSLTLLYILTPDFKNRLPSTYKIKGFLGNNWNGITTKAHSRDYNPWEHEWHEAKRSYHERNTGQNVNEFIMEVNDNTEKDNIIPAALYLGVFWSLVMKNISNFRKNDDSNTKLYPYTGWDN
jgi:hypothetical protein